MLFCDCVQDYFRTYLVQQRGYGPNTLASYRDTFRLLISYLMAEGKSVDGLDMADVTPGVVTGFLCWLESERGNASSTRNVRLAHLKSFASYTMTVSPEDAGTCSSITSVASKRQPWNPPDALSKDEVECLLAAPGTGTRNGLRDSALLTLLYDSACRAQEIVDLDVRDVVVRGVCSVFVTGKGDRSRRVPLLAGTGELVGAYVHAFSLPPDSPLFLNRSGNRLTRAGVSNVVERHWRKVIESSPGIAMHAHVKPHMLRHSKATHLIEAKVNIFYVRDFLGHASVATTQAYLKSNLGHLREVVESAAAATAGSNMEYYTPSKRAELLEFLDSFI